MKGNSCSLEGWSKIFQEQEEEAVKRLKTFNDNLPPPDYTLNIDGEMYGYWKSTTKNMLGIVRMRKYKNGYHEREQFFISKEEIEAINIAWNK